MAVSIAQPKAEGDLWDLQPCCAQRHPNGGGLGGGILGRDPHLWGGNPQFYGAVTPFLGLWFPFLGVRTPIFYGGVILNFGEV